LQNGFVAQGQPNEMPVARAVVPNVNQLAEATRESGGTVIWLKHTYDQETQTYATLRRERARLLSRRPV
jgi:ureidoacrylate peracid hydrolase